MIEAIIALCAVIVVLICALYHYTNRITALEYGLLTVRHEMGAMQQAAIRDAWGAHQAGETHCHGYKLPQMDTLL